MIPMFKRMIAPALFAAAFIAPPAFAQNAVPLQGPTADQQQMQQQQQQMIQQMMQNMQDKGIDPQEFFGQIRQQVQDGTFDPAAFQQQMVDKGIIDQNMLQQMNQMQDNAQKAQVSSLKDQLQATDDEWKLLQPVIQKVLNLETILGTNVRAGGMGGFMAQTASSDVSKALNDLRKVDRDPASTAEVVSTKLKAYRDAVEKAKSDLVSAQKELTELLKVRQEALLTNLGIL